MILNKSYIACLYYNLEKSNRYDLNNYTDRQLARKNFDNSKYHNKKRLEKAVSEYKKLIDNRLQELVKILEHKPVE